jgi:acetylornithine/succinyldiaminopimelate/putrescine aminotransferase
VAFASFDNLAELDKLITGTTAAVIVEPIQGEGGVRPIPAEAARAIASACARTGALLIADEVQSGSGRTGDFLYSPALGLQPDLIALGKALGGGVPIGVTMLSDTVAATIAAGDHGTTYGGNLLACRAALVVLDELERGLQASVRRASARLFEGLQALRARHASIVDVRGKGLIAGVDFATDAAPIVTAALERGLLVNRTSTSVIRLLPPYVVTDQDIDEGLAMLDDAIAHV